MVDPAADDETLVLAAQVRVPEHVTYREFADETVVLNLESGMYHGLNPTAARMLKTLDASASMGAAIESLTAEFERPRALIQRDVVALCRQLNERGLITRNDVEPG